MSSGRCLLMLFMLGLLGACAKTDEDQLKKWVQEQRMTMSPLVKPLPEPVKFSPQPYTATDVPDPFGQQKLAQALKRDAMQNSNTALISAELNRRKQPLEAFPLDTMTMVGSMVKQGQTFALIRVNNLIYQVQVGSYLAQNYGRVVSISENELILREIIQDPSGEWVERKTSLQLAERAK